MSTGYWGVWCKVIKTAFYRIFLKMFKFLLFNLIFTIRLYNWSTNMVKRFQSKHLQCEDLCCRTFQSLFNILIFSSFYPVFNANFIFNFTFVQHLELPLLCVNGAIQINLPLPLSETTSMSFKSDCSSFQEKRASKLKDFVPRSVLILGTDSVR